MTTRLFLSANAFTFTNFSISNGFVSSLSSSPLFSAFTGFISSLLANFLPSASAGFILFPSSSSLMPVV